MALIICFIVFKDSEAIFNSNILDGPMSKICLLHTGNSCVWKIVRVKLTKIAELRIDQIYTL